MRAGFIRARGEWSVRGSEVVEATGTWLMAVKGNSGRCESTGGREIVSD